MSLKYVKINVTCVFEIYKNTSHFTIRLKFYNMIFKHGNLSFFIYLRYE